MRPARDLAGFWPLAGLERAAPPRQNPAHHDRFFNPFDENGIARVEIEPYNDVYLLRGLAPQGARHYLAAKLERTRRGAPKRRVLA